MVNTDGVRHWCDSVEGEFKLLEGETARAARQVPQLFLACAIRYLRETARELDRAILEVRHKRIDAENPERDKLEGISMLRGWFRRLHMDLVGGWDQDTPQDRIAEVLGEYPRGHERAFLVNPEATEIRGLPPGSQERFRPPKVGDLIVGKTLTERVLKRWPHETHE